MNRRTFVAGTASALAVGPAIALPSAAEPHIVRAWVSDAPRSYPMIRMSDGTERSVPFGAVQIKVDGIPAHRVVSADVAGGVLCFGASQISGHPYMDPVTGATTMHTLHGKVEITLASA